MDPEKQASIDERILAFYNDEFDEDTRLRTRSLQGELEFQRTQEIIASHVSAGRILDIGGGTGRHAAELIVKGHDVELVDPVPKHVEAAARAGINARLGDARMLPYENDTFDATLLLGPLYHLASRESRLTSIHEAARVTRSGGFVFAAALSRFIAFGEATLGITQPIPYPQPLMDLLTEGRVPNDLRFPAGHFHTAEELHAELEAAGLAVIEVVGVEGPAGILLEKSSGQNDVLAAAAMTIARTASGIVGIRDFSPHLLAVAQVLTS